ncbi:MAG: TRL domain-containing protein [Leptospiraceae bacterium]
MKRYLRLFIPFALLGLMQCISSPMQGQFLTFTEHTVHDRITGNIIGNGEVSKRGESCSYGSGFLLPFFYGGGRSLEEAMADGKISQIAVIDHSSLAVLGGLFMHRECIVVWGS